MPLFNLCKYFKISNGNIHKIMIKELIKKEGKKWKHEHYYNT